MTSQVLLGEHDPNTAVETNMQRMKVIEIVEQPYFNITAKLNNDFAMLKLMRGVDYCAHPHIRPVCLPTDTLEKFAGVDAILTGWGKTSEGGSYPSSLLDVTVKIIKNSECQQKYIWETITSQMICDYHAGGGKASCQVLSNNPTEWLGVP